MSTSRPTAVHLALRELRAYLATRLGRLTLLGLIVVPTIYAGLYLYANHDPYGGLSRVPAAIVVEDAGATTADGKQLDAGDEVSDQLIEDGSFDWHRATADEAEVGVEQGVYDFALVIPRDFSRSLVSSTPGDKVDPRQAQMRMVTNDANSYLSTTIANTVTDTVRTAISERVSKEATASFLLGIADVRHGLQQGANGAKQLADGTEQARDGATRLVDGAGQLKDGATRLSAGAGDLASGADTLASGLDTMQGKVAPLPSQTRQLADGASQVAAGNERIAAIGDEVAGRVHEVRDRYRSTRADLVQIMREQGLTAEQREALLAVYDDGGAVVQRADDRATKASGELDRLASGARQVADGNRRLADAMPALVAGIDQADSGAHRLADGARQLQTGADDLAAGAGRLQDGARELRGGLTKLDKGANRLHRSLQNGVAQIPATSEQSRQRIAATVANPVSVDDASQASADSYGAGLAPFFMALATWIGGYVMFVVLKPILARRRHEQVGGRRAAFAGWLPAALLGSLQVSLMVVVVAFAVGVTPVQLPGTWLFLLLTSLVFTAIVHAFTAALGLPGSFLALVLMVVQLVTAGGTFPWQTLPTPLHPLHHALPMSYAVDGLRMLMYGAPHVRLATDVLVLLAWGLVAVAVEAVLGRRWRAPVGEPATTH